MNEDAKKRLVAKVPELDPYLARMVVLGAGESDTQNFAASLKSIAENRETDAEIVALANRLLRRELRVSGLERWPELYTLINAA